jgi:uncharacterized integral membrane protein
VAREERDGGGFRPDWRRLVAAAAIAALVLWFALANRQRVTIDFLFTDRETRLVWVIVGAALLGAAADRLLAWRARRRR